jgi:hypothetical protein
MKWCTVARRLAGGALFWAALIACLGDEPEFGSRLDAGGARDADGADSHEPLDGSDALAPKDASGACDRSAPFSSISPLVGVNSPDDEFYPRVSSDERVLYFERFDRVNRTRSFFRAARSSRQDPFDPHPVRDLPENPCAPFVTEGELAIYFSLPCDGPSSLLHVARRADRGDPFGEPTEVPINAAGRLRYEPWLSPSGSELFFTDRLADGGSEAVWRALMDADEGVVDAGVLPALESPQNDSGPVLSPDALSLYFYAERGKAKHRGSIWVSHRDAIDMPFGAPAVIPELVFSDAYSSPGTLSADGCRLYFYSDKQGAAGADLFVAERR